MSTISSKHFAELLTAAKARIAARKQAAETQEAVTVIDNLQKQMEAKDVTTVDLSLAGATASSTTEEKQEVVDNLIDAMLPSSRDSSYTLPSNSSRQPNPIICMPAYLDQSKRQAVVLVPKKEEAASNASIETTAPFTVETELPEIASSKKVIGVARDDIVLNEKQQLFNTTVLSGESCILVGAAGTGKTTSMRTVTRNLISSRSLQIIKTGTKHLQIGAPGAAVLSFTNKAVNNIRHAVVQELKAHTLTIHKLLEFAPEFYEIADPNNPGSFKNTMRFIPTRTKYSPLPAELTFIAFEESSMIGTELYELLQEAMPHKHQEVFLGDIQQLPPVFGSAILGFKMLELPVIELTEVYRQAAESPIIDLAWKILSGDSNIFSPRSEQKKIYNEKTKKDITRIAVPSLNALSRKVTLYNNTESEVKFQIWQKQLTVDYANLTAIKQFCAWEEAGYYNAEEDIILCPFNKGVGTIEINKGISDYLGKKRNVEVTEVIAGFNKHYLAVGDRVLYDKEDAVITSIRRNTSYFGKQPIPPSVKLDRWGHLHVDEMTEAEKLQRLHDDAGSAEMDLAQIEAFMDAAAAEDKTERVQSSSHVIELRYSYADELDAPIVLATAGEVNNLLGGYCITVHKFQGSEADRVFLLYHHSHHVGVMMSREAIYTAVTRAKLFLHIICEKDSFYKAVKCQAVRGDTLAEKAEVFKGKKLAMS